MAKHWSEVYSCRCGKTFRSYAAEAVHRHNFPALCRAPPLKYRFREEITGRTVTVESRAGERDARRRAHNVMCRRVKTHLSVEWNLTLLETE